MNPVIQAQLRDFSKAHSIASDQEDIRFEIYSIFSAMNGLLSEKIDAYDIHLRGSEFGVDGIAIIVQGESVRNRHEAEEKLQLIKSPIVEFIFF